MRQIKGVKDLQTCTVGGLLRADFSGNGRLKSRKYSKLKLCWLHSQQVNVLCSSPPKAASKAVLCRVCSTLHAKAACRKSKLNSLMIHYLSSCTSCKMPSIPTMEAEFHTHARHPQLWKSFKLSGKHISEISMITDDLTAPVFPDSSEFLGFRCVY